MKYLILLAVIFNLGILGLHADQNQVAEFAKGQKLSWSSKNHAKSKGINMKISYPATWTAAEGTRPNIVQKFTSNRGKGMDMVMLLTRTLPAPYDRELTAEEKNEILAKDVAVDMLPEGSKLLSHKLTKIDGETCAMIEFSTVGERAGVKIAQKALFFIIPRPGTLLFIQCLSGADASKGMEELDTRFESVKMLYVLIASSCVFVDKWEE